MSIKGELTTNKDETELFPWTATFKTEEYGTFYGHGETEEKAIANVEQASQGIINQFRNGE